MNASQTHPQTSPLKESGVVRLAALLATPLIPDDYIELVNPLWTRSSLRARVEAVIPETADSASLVLKPGLRWQGHQAGQFLRVGVDIDGVRHWRCYSISSAPERADGLITITVKAVEGGRVSNHLMRELQAGAVLEIAAAEGEFVQPQGHGDSLLMITGGSGLTPVMSQLRSAAARGAMPECTVIHYAPTAGDCLFRDELLSLAARYPQLKLQLVYTRGGQKGSHFNTAQLEALCPDWRSRRVYTCGPSALLASVETLWADAGLGEQLIVERFRPALAAANAGATGGALNFVSSACKANSNGRTSILDTAEQAGLAPAHGCRMGICHGCTARLICGQVRDLRTGQVFGETDDLIQICVCAPAGDVQIDL